MNINLLGLLKPFRINALCFALLWIAYCIISHHLTVNFALGGWSTLITLPISFLFYTTICISLLVQIILHYKKIKGVSIIFYPKIFLFLVLLPQILFALFNPVRDYGDSAFGSPNLLGFILGNHFITFINLISPLTAIIGIIALITYIKGLIIFSKKIFYLEAPAKIKRGRVRLLEKLSEKIKFFALFCIFFIIVIISSAIQDSAFAKFFPLMSPLMQYRYTIEFKFWHYIYSADLCPFIIDISKRDECYKYSSGLRQDLSACEKIINLDSKDQCFKKVGIAKQDLSICDMINSQGIKDACYSEIGIVKQDILICDKIENYLPKLNCYIKTGDTKQGLNVCDTIIASSYQSSYNRDSCYTKIATAEKNISLCEIITDQNNKDDCYLAVGVAKRDILICDKIAGKHESRKKSKCYLEIAIAKQDLLMCDDLGNNKEECYKGIGIIKNDLSICEKITFQMYKSQCLAAIAINKKDRAICNKIEDDYYKKLCDKATPDN